MTKPTLFEAINAAADHIEKHPNLYSFMTGEVPRAEYQCGCALGWIAFFSQSKERFYHDACIELFGFDRVKFYSQLSRLEGFEHWTDGRWVHEAVVCVNDLRLYANKYHAPTIQNE